MQCLFLKKNSLGKSINAFNNKQIKNISNDSIFDFASNSEIFLATMMSLGLQNPIEQNLNMFARVSTTALSPDEC